MTTEKIASDVIAGAGESEKRLLKMELECGGWIHFGRERSNKMGNGLSHWVGGTCWRWCKCMVQERSYRALCANKSFVPTVCRLKCANVYQTLAKSALYGGGIISTFYAQKFPNDRCRKSDSLEH